MEKLYTSKLFYKKYPFKILIVRTYCKTDPDYHTGWTVQNAKNWLGEQTINHRMYNQVISKNKKKGIKIIRSSIFVKSRAEFEKCIDKWKADVFAVTSPYKDEHIQFLTENTEVSIRQKLVYKKFRYIITIKKHWREDIQDFEDWINANFTRDNAKYVTNGWWPRLYLRDENDLVLLKLAYDEKISKLCIIYTFDELESKP
jgi:hypothetical protein